MAEIRTRTMHFNTLKKLLDKVLDHPNNPLTMEEVTFLLTRAESVMEKIEATHLKIIATCADDAAAQVQEAAFEPIMDTHLQVNKALYDIRQQLNGSTGRSSTTKPTVKLPEMQLPVFQGNYENWPSFSDLFCATIDSNTNLSDAQKLQYLRSCLQGDAANLIRAFPITDTNYAEAWALLASRYNNKREIVNSIVKKLLYQPSLKQASSSFLQTLLNTTQECIRSLKVMGQPTEKWDALLVVIIVEKLDPETKSEWAKTLKDTDPSPFSDLITFMKMHIRALSARGSVGTASSSTHNATSSSFKKASHHVSTQEGFSCSLCKSRNHYLYRCPELTKLQPSQRFSTIQQKTNACTNCLRTGHAYRDCPTQQSCKRCSRRHHTLLHVEQGRNDRRETTTPNSSTANQPPVQSHTASVNTQLQSQVLLKTAIVNVQDSAGHLHPCRVLLDDGSEASFVTERCAQALNLPKQGTDMQVQGIGALQINRAKWKTTVRLHSTHHSAYVDVETFVLPKVTGKLPRVACDSRAWPHLHGLQLADPTYNEPSDIDMLLGADVVPSIMRDGRREGTKLSPIAMNTIFGWVLAGKMNVTQQNVIATHHTTCRLEEEIHRFWKIEEVPKKKPLSAEEMLCEVHYRETYSRKPDGRFIVRLPFNEKKSQIGSTYDIAMRRLLQQERRLNRQPQHRDEYIDFMREYEQLGHMEKVEDNTIAAPNAVYIPHHFVLKENSTTTKLRVVFDASLKPADGVSLNDALMVGPTVQEDLYTLLLRFRLHKIALKADIAKMYRQFEVHPDDRNYQRILWREHPSSPVQIYRLKTNTYGLASVPYTACKSLSTLADIYSHKYPNASHALKSETYVDDLLSGAKSTIAAATLADGLQQLCREAGLELRKWSSNDPEALQTIPVSLRETSPSLEFDTTSTVKALGVRWKPQEDVFYFEASVLQQQSWTKRKILSQIAKTFDPIGWLSPITITARIIFQDLWRDAQDWDQPTNQPILSRWQTYIQQMERISTISVPRCIIPTIPILHELHAFADASEKAYAVAVYLRCKTGDNQYYSNLVTAKAKVAPLEQVSLPRLELCAAELLAETVYALSSVFQFKYKLFAWSDSMIVLKWLSSPSKNWKTYVANRVASIQQLIPSAQWQHVRSKQNPADLPSRGVSVMDLQHNALWWNGPSWLCSEEYPTTGEAVDNNEVQKEQRKNNHYVAAHAATTHPSPLSLIFTHHSSLSKIISTVAWFKRFLSFLKTRSNTRKGPLSCSERKLALQQIIKLIQHDTFGDCLNHQFAKNLQKLNPFVDTSGVVRVGGRIQNCGLNEDIKHPIILPGRHPHNSHHS